MSTVNDGVRFIVELCGLAAVAYWGWRTGNATAAKLLVSVGAVLAIAVVWAVFRAESDAIVEVPTAVRVLIEVTVFAAATAALAAVGRTRLAIVFGVIAAVNEILNYTLD